VSGHSPLPSLRWSETGETRSARWRSESGAAAPARVVIATDNSHTADAAHRLACEGTALLWRGDFQNARQLLQAMARRIDHPRSGPRHPEKAPAAPSSPGSMSEAFNRYRLMQSQRARVLGMLLIPIEADYRIPLRRAPDMREAFREVWGEAAATPSVASLRELLGLTGAHEWRKKGVEIPALEARIHPHYGVFSPLRGEYVELAAHAPLPGAQAVPLAFDIGTGTGVLAALLAKRGVARVIATDSDARAIACARENLARLGYADRVDLVQTDMFPEGRAALVVCNPPWLPARPSSPLEQAIFDPEGRMLRAFLKGLAAHLEPGGEGWLILSDLAEHLGLRTRDELLAAIGAAGLNVLGRADMPPRHPRAADERDPLHAARRAELISLWRLGTG
jgi:methylase of polypeptide subunit release factors